MHPGNKRRSLRLQKKLHTGRYQEYYANCFATLSISSEEFYSAWDHYVDLMIDVVEKHNALLCGFGHDPGTEEIIVSFAIGLNYIVDNYNEFHSKLIQILNDMPDELRKVFDKVDYDIGDAWYIEKRFLTGTMELSND